MGAAHSSAGAVGDDDIAKIFKRLDPSETGSIGEEQVISLIEVAAWIIPIKSPMLSATISTGPAEIIICQKASSK